MSNTAEPGTRISQAHPQYPRDVAGDMVESPLTDGRKEIGRLIEKAYEDFRVRYLTVHTGGRDAILRNDPTKTVRDIFVEPTEDRSTSNVLGDPCERTITIRTGSGSPSTSATASNA
jgi:hypothetical protein